jgi:hypothetical protein
MIGSRLLAVLLGMLANMGLQCFWHGHCLGFVQSAGDDMVQLFIELSSSSTITLLAKGLSGHTIGSSTVAYHVWLYLLYLYGFICMYVCLMNQASHKEC